MGYNAYDHVGCCASEATMKAQGAALVSTGLSKLGYVYVNSDCGWIGGRSANGTLYPNAKKFPGGMKALADWLHVRGLKLGLYSDRGTHDFSGSGLGMKNHEASDARTMASWGVDYLKVDDMSGTPKTEAGAFHDYSVIRDALNATGRPIFFSTCGHSGGNATNPGTPVWMGPKCAELANACRVTQDVRYWGDGSFGSDKAVNAMASYGGRASFSGAWPDPDLLFSYAPVGPGATKCNGAGKLEYCTGSFCDPVVAHSVTQFRLWAVMGAPLLLSFDLANLDATQLATYGNAEIVAINQDADEHGRGVAGGRRVSGDDLVGPVTLDAAAASSGKHSAANVARRAAAGGARATTNSLAKACSNASFPYSRVGVECIGLQPANVTSATACIAACCAMGAACHTWQWNPTYNKGHGHQPCWIGAEHATRWNSTGWVAGGSTLPSPTPPPTPAPPTSLNTQNVWARNLHSGATALLFINNGAGAVNMTCDAACALAAGLVDGTTYSVRDVGERRDLVSLTLQDGVAAGIIAGDAGSLLLLLTPLKQRRVLAEASGELQSVVASGEWMVYNPHAVEDDAVHTIHMVLSSHFDGGCKTPACTTVPLQHGEPNVCAYVGAGNANGATDPTHNGEPWNYHIINRYFDEFFPNAIARAEEARGTDTPWTYMTQPWIVALYLDCANAGLNAWPEAGFENGYVGPVLHCPNATSLASFKAAMQRGDIFMQAFPHDGEAGYYPDASLFEAALSVGEGIAAELDIAPPRVISQRDVPGWTRATLPLLKKHGINGISFGAGTPPGKADVPPLFVWRDVASNTDIVTTYETAYGNVKTVFILPNGVALAVQWQGDNTGPAPVKDVSKNYADLRGRYAKAAVNVSTFEAFFDEASKPEVKSLLPIVTHDILDGWIYGVPSDPLKNSIFREASRQRLACVEAGQCDPTTDSEVRAFDRLLVKVPEHTWGVAQSWFLPDYENYTNVQFDAARAQQKDGFVLNNTLHADYNSTVNSWLEQRTFVTDAPQRFAKSGKHGALAASLDAAFKEIKEATPISDAAAAGYAQVNAMTSLFQCGAVRLGFDVNGAIGTLTESRGAAAAAWDWAGGSGDAAHALGKYVYQSFTSEDYATFLTDFSSRIGDKGVWPSHTESHDKGCTRVGDDGSHSCGNFRKPNVSAAAPVHRNLSPTVVEVWAKGSAAAKSQCDFIIKAKFPDEAITLAGAPNLVVIEVSVVSKNPASPSMTTSVNWSVFTVEKRPTRLPEAIFFANTPHLPAPTSPSRANGWLLTVLNHTMDPTDVVGSLGKDYNTTVYGGSPHLRGIEAARWGGGSSGIEAATMTLTSLDVPVVALGEVTPFPTPRTEAPDMVKGVHWNIVQNIWNTNYVLWYPYTEADATLRSRFEMVLDHTPNAWTFSAVER